MEYGITKRLYGLCMETETYRAMLDYIKAGCYVESESTGQHGTVVSVIKSCNDVPICVKVEIEKNKYDYISLDRVSLFEPYDTWCTCLWAYSDDALDGCERWFADNDYTWDNDKMCYVNAATGDEMIF